MPKQAIKKTKTVANVKIEAPKMDRQKMNQVLKGRVVSAGKTLKTVVVPFFQKHTLESKRIKDFRLFCTILNLALNKAHHTKRGIAKIQRLKSQMHA